MNIIITENDLTAVINNKSYTLRKEHPNFRLVVDGIKNKLPETEIVDLMDVTKSVVHYTDGKVEVRDGQVFYDNEPVQGTLVERLLSFMQEGLPHEPYIKFLENLMQNPSSRSRSQLYRFLEHKSLPITDDGCFLAYKGVRDNYLDCHSGTIDNNPGRRITMPRSRISDDPDLGCHTGLHVGSEEYATSFGQRTVIVKVNPRNVVSVPLDCECQKMRVCEYEVTADYAGSMRPTYSSSNTGYGDNSYYNDTDNDCSDEDESGACSTSVLNPNRYEYKFTHQV